MRIGSVSRAVIFLLLSASLVTSFTLISPPAPTKSRLTPTPRYASPDNDNHQEEKKNKFLDFMFNPYESKIPKELEAEIYRAEGNTPAAQERTKRIVAYGIIAITLVGCAFFNGFLTELRHGPLIEENPSLTLEDLGFGWVKANFLLNFLFTNKIGGGLALISGAASGMLAEAELDSRRKNAERIWEELERRRNAGSSGSSNRKTQTTVVASKKMKTSGKQKKRLGALSEVVLEEQPAETEAKAEATQHMADAEEGGIMGKLKGWYDKADSMAASQALLLNKELEDRGVVEKITDETGLKVIGKDAASKLKKAKQESTTAGGAKETNE